MSELPPELQGINPVRIQFLVDLRKAVKPLLSQTKVAAKFGLDSKHGRKTIGAWENGEYAPDEKQRRAKFISYLWDDLRLRNDPEKFEELWQILVEEWRWATISDAEWKSFTNVPRPNKEDKQPQQDVMILKAPEPQRPQYAEDFVGRMDALEAYSKKLNESGIAQITGAAGVGKTAIAAQLAIKTGGTEDRIFWCSCYPDRDEYSFIWGLAEFLAWLGDDEIWRMLHASSQGGNLPPANTLYDSLFETILGRKFILCFDDFHHIYTDDSQRELVDRLVAAASSGDCKLIVTAQQTTSLGEYISEPLTGLNLEDTQIFLNTRGLPLEQSLMQKLHNRTEGNATLLSLSAQALEKSENPANLIEQLVDTAEVEKFLLEEIDSTLVDDEKMVMSGVSALLGYRGTADAIEEVLDEDGIRRPLVHLANRYLLEKHINEEELEVTYSQHNIIQRFYYQLLGKKRKRRMHRRAGEYYETEVEDSFLAALHYQHAREHEKSAELATKEATYHIHRGRAPATRSLLAKYNLESFSPLLAAKVKVVLADTYEFIEEWQAALKHYQDALQLLRSQPESDEIRIVQSKAYRGIVIVLRTRNPDETLQWIEQGLEIVAGVDPIAEADLCIQLGAVKTKTNSLNAKEPLEQALRLLSSVTPTPESIILEMRARINLGIHLALQDEVDRAEKHWLNALKLAREYHYLLDELVLITNLGTLYQMIGRWKGATAKYDQANGIAESLGKRIESARLKINSGILSMKKGNYVEANANLTAGTNLAKKIEQHEITTSGLWGLALLYMDQNDTNSAVEQLNEALELIQTYGLGSQYASIKCALAQAYFMDGELDKALENVEQSLKDATARNNKIEEGTALRVLGQIKSTQEKSDQATTHFEQSINALQSDPYELACTQEAFGDHLLANANANPKQAHQLFVSARQNVRALEIADSINRLEDKIQNCVL